MKIYKCFVNYAIAEKVNTSFYSLQPRGCCRHIATGARHNAKMWSSGNFTDIFLEVCDDFNPCDKVFGIWSII